MKRALPALFRNTWIAYPLLLLAAFSVWAYSSPSGSSPDEDFHLVSAWCALGPRDGLCAPGSTDLMKVVPANLLDSMCYAFKPELAGNCPSGARTIETARGNFAGYYPDGFYKVMGLFAGPSLSQSVLAMRLLNSIIYALGLTTLLLLVPPARRASYMLGSLVTLVPLGMFIVASMNPSSWAVTAATLFWASAVELLRATDRRKRIGLGLLALFALTLALSSRGDAAAYAALGIGLAWLLTAKWNRTNLILGAVAAGIGAACILWSLSSGSWDNITAGPNTSPAEPIDGWYQRLQDVPSLLAGSFGTWPLGWLDTPLRSLTSVLAGSAYVMALFWGLRRCGWRKAVSLLAILGLATGVPIVIATTRHVMLHQAVSARYFFPLLVMLAMVALAEGDDDGPRLRPAQGVVIVAALAVAHAEALHTNMRRYLTGLDDFHFDLNAKVDWWWNGPPAPMVMFMVGCLTFIAAAVVVIVVECGKNDIGASGARRVDRGPAQDSSAATRSSNSNPERVWDEL